MSFGEREAHADHQMPVDAHALASSWASARRRISCEPANALSNSAR